MYTNSVMNTKAMFSPPPVPFLVSLHLFVYLHYRIMYV